MSRHTIAPFHLPAMLPVSTPGNRAGFWFLWIFLYKGSTQGDGIVVKDIAIDTTQRSKISFPTGGGIAVNFSR